MNTYTFKFLCQLRNVLKSAAFADTFNVYGVEVNVRCAKHSDHGMHVTCDCKGASRREAFRAAMDVCRFVSLSATSITQVLP